MATGGGKPLGSTATKRAVCPPVAAHLPPLTCADLEIAGPARGDVARFPRGGGRADLYSWRAPQRAGPTARKAADSNAVLPMLSFSPRSCRVGKGGKDQVAPQHRSVNRETSMAWPEPAPRGRLPVPGSVASVAEFRETYGD